MFNIRRIAPSIVFTLGISVECVKVQKLGRTKENHIEKLAMIYHQIDKKGEDIDLLVKKGFEVKLAYCAVDQELKKSFIYKIALFLCNQKMVDYYAADTEFEAMILSAPLPDYDQKGLIFDPHGWNSAHELECRSLFKDEQLVSELFNRSVHLREELIANTHKHLIAKLEDLEKGALQNGLSQCESVVQRAAVWVMGKISSSIIKTSALNHLTTDLEDMDGYLNKIEEIEDLLRVHLLADDPTIDGFEMRQHLSLTIAELLSWQQVDLDIKLAKSQELLTLVESEEEQFKRDLKLMLQLEERNVDLPEDLGETEDYFNLIGQAFAGHSYSMAEAAAYNILASQAAILHMD